MSNHGHPHARGDYGRAFGIGIVLNVGFVAIEGIVGWQVNSLALLADAGHNLSDVAGLLLAWGAVFVGRLPPDHRHTYGWRRASILAAFANAILLLVAMGALAWEAIGRLGAPTQAEGFTIIVVAAVGVIVNGITAALFMSGRSTDLNIRGAFLHMAADAMVSLGVVAAGALYIWTGWGWVDPVTSLAIATFIVIGSLGLLKQSVHLMFDGVPESVNLVEVRSFLLSQPRVSDVHDLHVWAMSTSDIALSVHLVMPGGCPDDAFLESLSSALKDRYAINHPTIQVERGGADHGCVAPRR